MIHRIRGGGPLHGLGPTGSRAMVRQNIVVGTHGKDFSGQGGSSEKGDIEETGTGCPQGPAPNGQLLPARPHLLRFPLPPK